MKDKLRSLARIEPGQELNVSMLAAQSFFMGIFFGAFDIVAYSLLLSAFEEKMMARGLLVSGVLTMMLFYISSKLRLSLRNTLVICTVISFLTWSLLILSINKWFIFVAFILAGPMNIFAYCSVSETVNQFKSVTKETNLSFLADAGLIAGIILISFFIPVLLVLGLSPVNILIPGATALFAVLFLNNKLKGKPGAIDQAESGMSFAFINFRKYRLIRIMALFACISILTGFIIQYSFLAVARIHFTSASGLASFLGLFIGSIMIVSGFVKWIVFPHLLHRYGIRICFLFSPSIIAISSTVTLIAGAVSGINSKAFFFLAIISAFLSTLLIFSILTPSFKVIYRSFDKRLRGILETNKNNWLKPFPLVISGIILSAFGFLDFRLIYFSALLVVPVLIWMFVAYRIHDFYKNQISEIPFHEEYGTLVTDNVLKNRFAGYLMFKTNYYNLIAGDYSFLNKTTNRWFFDEIIDYSWSKKDINLLPALKKVSFISNLDEEIRKHSSEVLEILQKKTVYFKYEDDKTAEAVKILSGTRMPQTSQILSLLRNKSLESKKLAIFMIGKFQISDLLSVVCDCLNTPGLTKEAYEVLNSFGPEVEQELIKYYFVSSGNPKISKLIIQLLGKVRTKETSAFLFSRLWSNSRRLKEFIIKSLLSMDFKPSEEEIHKLDQLASEVIGIIAWNLSAKYGFEKHGDGMFADIINHETERWKNFLFDILSLNYGKEPVLAIRQNSGDKTIEGIVATFELTDSIVSSYLSPRLKGLFEYPAKVQLKKLRQFYTVELPSTEKLFEDILNRDYNLISLWTKVIALRSISKIEGEETKQSVTALLFSPEEIIREESAVLIGRVSAGLFYSASHRLSEPVRSGLEKIINKTTNEKHLLFEKVKFLSKYFTGIPEDELLPLAAETIYLVTFGGEILKSRGGFMVWPLNSGDEVYIFYNGESDILSHRFRDRHDLSFYILPLKVIEEYHFLFPEQSIEILKYIDLNQA